MPELAPAARGAAHGALPRRRKGGRRRCFLCGGPDARWIPALYPEIEARYHRNRFHWVNPPNSAQQQQEGAAYEAGDNFAAALGAAAAASPKTSEKDGYEHSRPPDVTQAVIEWDEP